MRRAAPLLALVAVAFLAHGALPAPAFEERSEGLPDVPVPRQVGPLSISRLELTPTPLTAPGSSVVAVCWKIHGTGTTPDTGVVIDEQSRSSGTATRGSYTLGTFYPDNSTTKKSYTLTGSEVRICTGILLRSSGSTYLRAYVDGVALGPSLTPEARIDVPGTQGSGGSIQSVQFTSVPATVTAGQTLTACWRVEGSGTATETAVATDGTTHATDGNTAAYAGPAYGPPTGTSLSLPFPYCANIPTSVPGTLYLRARARMGTTEVPTPERIVTVLAGQASSALGTVAGITFDPLPLTAPSGSLVSVCWTVAGTGDVGGTQVRGPEAKPGGTKLSDYRLGWWAANAAGGVRKSMPFTACAGVPMPASGDLNLRAFAEDQFGWKWSAAEAKVAASGSGSSSAQGQVTAVRIVEYPVAGLQDSNQRACWEVSGSGSPTTSLLTDRTPHPVVVSPNDYGGTRYGPDGASGPAPVAVPGTKKVCAQVRLPTFGTLHLRAHAVGATGEKYSDEVQIVAGADLQEVGRLAQQLSDRIDGLLDLLDFNNIPRLLVETKLPGASTRWHVIVPGTDWIDLHGDNKADLTIEIVPTGTGGGTIVITRIAPGLEGLLLKVHVALDIKVQVNGGCRSEAEYAGLGYAAPAGTLPPRIFKVHVDTAGDDKAGYEAVAASFTWTDAPEAFSLLAGTWRGSPDPASADRVTVNDAVARTVTSRVATAACVPSPRHAVVLDLVGGLSGVTRSTIVDGLQLKVDSWTTPTEARVEIDWTAPEPYVLDATILSDDREKKVGSRSVVHADRLPTRIPKLVLRNEGKASTFVEYVANAEIQTFRLHTLNWTDDRAKPGGQLWVNLTRVPIFAIVSVKEGGYFSYRGAREIPSVVLAADTYTYGKVDVRIRARVTDLPPVVSLDLRTEDVVDFSAATPIYDFEAWIHESGARCSVTALAAPVLVFPEWTRGCARLAVEVPIVPAVVRLATPEGSVVYAASQGLDRVRIAESKAGGATTLVDVAGVPERVTVHGAEARHIHVTARDRAGAPARIDRADVVTGIRPPPPLVPSTEAAVLLDIASSGTRVHVRDLHEACWELAVDHAQCPPLMARPVNNAQAAAISRLLGPVAGGVAAVKVLDTLLEPTPLVPQHRIIFESAARDPLRFTFEGGAIVWANTSALPQRLLLTTDFQKTWVYDATDLVDELVAHVHLERPGIAFNPGTPPDRVALAPDGGIDFGDAIGSPTGEKRPCTSPVAADVLKGIDFATPAPERGAFRSVEDLEREGTGGFDPGFGAPRTGSFTVPKVVPIAGKPDPLGGGGVCNLTPKGALPKFGNLPLQSRGPARPQDDIDRYQKAGYEFVTFTTDIRVRIQDLTREFTLLTDLERRVDWNSTDGVTLLELDVQANGPDRSTLHIRVEQLPAEVKVFADIPKEVRYEASKVLPYLRYHSTYNNRDWNNLRGNSTTLILTDVPRFLNLSLAFEAKPSFIAYDASGVLGSLDLSLFDSKELIKDNGTKWIRAYAEQVGDLLRIQWGEGGIRVDSGATRPHVVRNVTFLLTPSLAGIFPKVADPDGKPLANFTLFREKPLSIALSLVEATSSRILISKTDPKLAQLQPLIDGRIEHARNDVFVDLSLTGAKPLSLQLLIRRTPAVLDFDIFRQEEPSILRFVTSGELGAAAARVCIGDAEGAAAWGRGLLCEASDLELTLSGVPAWVTAEIEAPSRYEIHAAAPLRARIHFVDTQAEARKLRVIDVDAEIPRYALVDFRDPAAIRFRAGSASHPWGANGTVSAVAAGVSIQPPAFRSYIHLHSDAAGLVGLGARVQNLSRLDLCVKGYVPVFGPPAFPDGAPSVVDRRPGCGAFGITASLYQRDEDRTGGNLEFRTFREGRTTARIHAAHNLPTSIDLKLALNKTEEVRVATGNGGALVRLVEVPVVIQWKASSPITPQPQLPPVAVQAYVPLESKGHGTGALFAEATEVPNELEIDLLPSPPAPAFNYGPDGRNGDCPKGYRQNPLFVHVDGRLRISALGMVSFGFEAADDWRWTWMTGQALLRPDARSMDVRLYPCSQEPPGEDAAIAWWVEGGAIDADLVQLELRVPKNVEYRWNPTPWTTADNSAFLLNLFSAGEDKVILDSRQWNIKSQIQMCNHRGAVQVWQILVHEQQVGGNWWLKAYHGAPLGMHAYHGNTHGGWQYVIQGGTTVAGAFITGLATVSAVGGLVGMAVGTVAGAILVKPPCSTAGLTTLIHPPPTE